MAVSNRYERYSTSDKGSSNLVYRCSFLRWQIGEPYSHKPINILSSPFVIRNLKVTLSIGGWTYSQDGHFSFVTDATKRATFVSSALQLVEDYGFDGVDLDFEYPSSTAQGQGLADLFTSLRSAFDSYAAGKGDSTPYLLTVRTFIFRLGFGS